MEYLNTLIERRHQHNRNSTVAIGMLVLIRDDSTPSMQWPLGRIIELHPGSDDITRTVSIQTSQGILKRAVTKIAILPILDNEEKIDQADQSGENVQS